MTQLNVMTPYALRAMATALVVTLALSGCSETKRALGYEKAPPDEFQVVQRAPLAMPPEFSLRPPAPGMTRPQEGSTRDQAKSSLTGSRPMAAISTIGRDTGDLSLLKRTGAEQAQVGIRELVNKESQALADSGHTFTEKLVFWRKPDAIGTGEQLNAEREAQRLRENQALGRAVTEGETPRIERARKGWLEGVF